MMPSNFPTLVKDKFAYWNCIHQENLGTSQLNDWREKRENLESNQREQHSTYGNIVIWKIADFVSELIETRRQ